MSEIRFRGTRARSVRVLASYAEAITGAETRFDQEMSKTQDMSSWRNMSEKAWVVMLVKQGVVSRKSGQKILSGILEIEKAQSGQAVSGMFLPTHNFGLFTVEKILQDRVGDEVAGDVNVGKTLPEPIVRLQTRDKILDVLCSMLDFRERLLQAAAENVDAVMPGYTHLAQGQAMTFGHYLLSVHDATERATNELERTYQLTNLNTLGCGALAGTSWNIDRELVAALLGFDGVLENANDAVAAGDYAISILAALTNQMVLISRFALDLHMWGMEEIAMIYVPEAYCDQSSMMPQKRNYGGQVERARIDASVVISRLQECVMLVKNEPYADMIPVLHLKYPILEALCITEKTLTTMGDFISAVKANKGRMLEFARRGFSCASELANVIRRKTGVAYRTAHHITGMLVRIAEEEKVPADQVTAEMLNKAAIKIIGRPLTMDDQEVRQALDPVHFVNVTDSRGGVAPVEVKRMIKDRIKRLEEAKKCQAERVSKLQRAQETLNKEVSAIIESA